MDLRGQLASVWLRRWPIVAAALLIATVVLVLQTLATPVYQTSSTLRVNVPGATGGERSETVEFYARTIVGLAETPAYFDLAVARSGLRITAETAEERVEVTETEIPGFLTLTATGPSPDASAALAGAASAALAVSLAEDEVTATENATAALREQIAALEAELAELAALPVGTPERAAAEQRYSSLVEAVTAVTARPAPSLLLGPPPVPSSDPVSPVPLRDALLALIVGLIVVAQGVVVARAVRGRVSEGDPAAQIEAQTDVPAVQLDGSGDATATLAALYRSRLRGDPAVTVVQLGRRPARDIGRMLADGAAVAGGEVHYATVVSAADSPGPGSTIWSLRTASVDSEALRLLRDRVGSVVVAVQTATTSLAQLRRDLDALGAVGAKPAAIVVWRGRFPRPELPVGGGDTALGGPETPDATAGAGRLVDLLGDVTGLRALVCGNPPQSTVGRLTAAGALVTPLLGTSPPEPPEESGGWDLVLCTGGRLDDPPVVSALKSIAPNGRVAVLVDNPWSPIRRMQTLRGERAYGVRASSAAKVRARLRTHDIQTAQVFGLLRSTAAPVTAFELAAPTSVRAVIAASDSHIGGARSVGLLMKRWAARESIGRMLPGMLVLGSRGRPAIQQDRITGMIGHRDSREVKLVRGSPPSVLDKRYAGEAEADAEAHALTVLTDADLRIAPRLLQRPTPRTVWMDWLPGDPLAVDRLSRRETIDWVERAAWTLIMLQRATLRPETGEVLVHGDFWLGNMLTAGDRIIGVIDWTESRWGAPQVDQEFLVDGLRGVPDALQAELRLRCARIFASA